MGGEFANNHPDAAIARVAARQHGVITLEQLEHAGIHERARLSRARAGRLHRIHRGVFAVGHRGLSKAGRWMAAVLACGEGAMLSHTSAAELWGILRARRPPSRAGVDVEVHVTVPSSSGRRRPGIVIHRSRTLTIAQITRRLGIPITTPSRTLADLRRTLPQPQFAAALREAEFLRLPVDRSLDPDHTRSELERRFLRLCSRRRIPQPEVNVRIGSFVVDFLWRSHRLVAELDGYGAHGGRSAFEADRARDLELATLGFRVVRITWRRLNEDLDGLVAALRHLLRK